MEQIRLQPKITPFSYQIQCPRVFHEFPGDFRSCGKIGKLVPKGRPKLS
jgi:hypothetical protein